MEMIPEPRGLTLDLNDENIVYEIPEDKVRPVRKSLQRASNVSRFRDTVY